MDVLLYALRYCDVEVLMRERGLSVDHTTVLHWVQGYAPELDRRCHPLSSVLPAPTWILDGDPAQLLIAGRWGAGASRSAVCTMLDKHLSGDHQARPGKAYADGA
jgi:hypothetical protein